MPKRKVKEEKPAKRLGKKEVLLAPVAMGASLLVALVIIPHFAPPPIPTKICLKGHNVDPFNVYPRIEVILDNKKKLLPSGVGNQTANGKECLHIIHTDAINKVHIEYIRPIRLTMADFMKIYSYDNKTITVMDNSTGIPQKEVVLLDKYNIHYSYFSDKGEFTRVEKAASMPPFTDNLVARVELISK